MVNASLSPEALKNDCPWDAICWKMASVVASGPPPQPQEQLKFLTVLLAAIAFKMSFCEPVGPPVKMMILASPGAIAIAIWMSKATSPFPLPRRPPASHKP